MSVEVRRCDATDLERLVSAASMGLRAHLRERWALQEQGRATLLIAFDRDDPCGQVTLLHRSKYDSVRSMLGTIPKMSALVAAPEGRGTGSALIVAAEGVARNMAAIRIGLAVELGNDGARRLYLRLGYHEWEHGTVVDRWIERGPDGQAMREHGDPCICFVKPLA